MSVNREANKYRQQHSVRQLSRGNCRAYPHSIRQGWVSKHKNPYLQGLWCSASSMWIAFTCTRANFALHLLIKYDLKPISCNSTSSSRNLSDPATFQKVRVLVTGRALVQSGFFLLAD